MSWIGLINKETAFFDPRGLERRDKRPEAQLNKGTLLMEVTPRAPGQPANIFTLALDKETRLRVRILPDRGFAMVLERAGNLSHCVVPWQAFDPSDPLHLSYVWNAPARQAEMRIETLSNGRTVRVPAPVIPAPSLEVLDGMLNGRKGRLGADLAMCAVSDSCEAMGPSPSLCAGTPVATPAGPVNVETLKEGDVVLGSDGRPNRVFMRVTRTFPGRGAFAPIRLNAPYFGLQRDVFAAPMQRVLLRGSDVEYAFGHEAVFAEARHLVNGLAASTETCGPTIRYHQVLLRELDTIQVAGAEMSSLSIGRIRRRPDDLARSLLGHVDRKTLPEHPASRYPTLARHEVMSLLQNRAA